LSLTAPVWSPYVAGAIIGLSQLPNQLLLGNSLGTSSTFVTLLNTLVSKLPGHTASRFQQTLLNGADLWQPVLSLGIVLGSYLAQASSKSGVAPSVIDSWKAVLTGALLIFGARFGNGCTSGHGISGVSKLNIGSLLATTAMFATGIGLARLSK
jgi:uncharacterized membrane protein YedE/YeeE